MQKRARVVESQKLRRTIKGKCRLNDPLRDSVSVSMAYFRLFILWILIITVDVVVGFRFELLWPFWLVSRSCYESFSKNQNTVVTLANQNTVRFSLFFVCITATSDLVCLIFIPVPWMIFLASTYVWVSLIWSTHGGFRSISLGVGGERSQVLPIALLGFFVITFEFFCRKRCDLLPYVADGNPFSSYIGLTRLPSCEHVQGLSPIIPRNLNAFFGAHCIGYPLVLISFSIRYYFREWLINRKKLEVTKRNELYQRLLTEALPAVYEGPQDYSIKSPPLDDGDADILDLPSAPMIMPASMVGNGTSSNGALKRSAKHAAGVRHRGNNGRAKTSTVVNPIQRLNERRREEDEDSDGSEEWREGVSKSSGGLSWLRLTYEALAWLVGTLTQSVDQEIEEEDDESQNEDSNKKISRNGDVNKLRASTTASRKGRGREKGKEKNIISQASDREKSSNGVYLSNGTTPPSPQLNTAQVTSPSPLPPSQSEQRDSSRETSVSQAVSNQSSSHELERLRSDVMQLKGAEQDARLQLTASRNNEASLRQEVSQLKNSLARMESRYASLEKQRENDRNSIMLLDVKCAELVTRKNEVERDLFNERNARKEDGGKKSETAEHLRERERQLEREIDRIRVENSVKDERLMKVEHEVNDLKKYKENNENDLGDRDDQIRNLQDKIKALEESLQSENKLKQDLFRALGDARTQNADLKEKLRSPDLALSVNVHSTTSISDKMSPSQSLNSSPTIANCSISPQTYNVAVQPSKMDSTMNDYLFNALKQHHSSPTGEHTLFDRPILDPSPRTIIPPEQIWGDRMGKFGAPANPARSN
ncbi:unnamed protein product [Auanema sp. JU1783]|nr:unnamed protein product [Auanema sp. JU1783]